MRSRSAASCGSSDGRSGVEQTKTERPSIDADDPKRAFDTNALRGSQLRSNVPSELLAVPHFYVVFSLPAEIADIAYTNKAVIYDLLFKVSADTMLTIAADPEHLGTKDRVSRRCCTSGLRDDTSSARARTGRRALSRGVEVDCDQARLPAARARPLGTVQAAHDRPPYELAPLPRRRRRSISGSFVGVLPTWT